MEMRPLFFEEGSLLPLEWMPWIFLSHPPFDIDHSFAATKDAFQQNSTHKKRSTTHEFNAQEQPSRCQLNPRWSLTKTFFFHTATTWLMSTSDVVWTTRQVYIFYIALATFTHKLSQCDCELCCRCWRLTRTVVLSCQDNKLAGTVSY